MRWLDRPRLALWRRRLRDPRFAFLADPAPPDELVAIDCETTSLDVRKAELLSIAAIPLRGTRILTSERLELLVRPRIDPSAAGVLIHHLRPLDVAAGLAPDQAIDRLLHFVASRPLVGYYLKYDVAILNKYVRPRLGVALPNRRIEVSTLYYDAKAWRSPHGRHIDLSFAALRADLDLPDLPEHDAFNDALAAAMMYLRLTGPGAGLRAR
jgi:DNA polymerase-3 subunit epsilon